ncbi:hypothetical protein PG995_015408 [Apiospora arundinis]|uniref:Uncharacterized protein n=1 Tax=Apiospora arundinis TaxID=335852 RepID=A0ABR2IFZ9_9PEZI
MSNRYIRYQVDTTQPSVRPMPVSSPRGRSHWADLAGGLIVGFLVAIAMMKLTALAIVLLRTSVRRVYRRQVSQV